MCLNITPFTVIHKEPVIINLRKKLNYSSLNILTPKTTINQTSCSKAAVLARVKSLRVWTNIMSTETNFRFFCSFVFVHCLRWYLCFLCHWLEFEYNFFVRLLQKLFEKNVLNFSVSWLAFPYSPCAILPFKIKKQICSFNS